MVAFLYFDLHHAIQEHDNIIDLSGGIKGIRDLGLLESILDHVKNDDYYPELEDKLTHLVFSIAMSHSFIDGNKRSAIALGAYFLEINGYAGIIGKFIIEMENIVLWVARGFINKKFLLEIITNLIARGDLSEEIKIKIYDLLDDEEKLKLKQRSAT